MTPGFSSDTWRVNLERFILACGKARGAETRETFREHRNDALAYWHILTRIADKYGWPAGNSLEKLRAMVPERIQVT